MKLEPRGNLKIALLVSACSFASGDFRPANAAEAPHDLGRVAPNEIVSATLWLKPKDDAAFRAAIAERMDQRSGHYHEWLTIGEVRTLGAAAVDTNALARALRAEGLEVTPRGEGTEALRVSGPAARMEAAFGTSLHEIQDGAGRYRMATGEPAFAGPGGDLVGGITGLTTAPMRPYVLHQIDPGTGKPVQAILSGRAAIPPIYTTNCFKRTETARLTHFVPNGGSEHVVVTGPGYVATGVSPAKATCGYTPAQVAAHYGLPAVYAAGYQGEGQTIVLVDAYGSPTIRSDANQFSSMMGLPSLNAGNFSIVYSDGLPIANPYPTGWPVEISLDVEWAHALAPKAKIVLVVAPSDDANELAYAVNYAVSHRLGEIISNSYGYPEKAYGPATARAFDTVIERAAAQGIAVNVSTGDSGDFGLGTPVGAASIPADSSFATGIGGTSLGVPSDIGPVETAWGTTETYLGDINGIPVPPDFLGFRQGGGGGESGYLPKPSWQAALPGTGRQLPDVSAVADPFTGAIIVTPNGDGTQTLVEVIGGTSLSSPVFSGIWALANEAAGTRLGQAAPIIARMPRAALRDIVPIQATRSNLSGVVGIGTQSTTYGAAALLNLVATQPNGFVGAAVQLTSPSAGIGALYDIAFGADSSLMALPGWDNATGYGVPNGLSFIRAAGARR